MSNNVKKIAKYLLIVAALGAIVFFGVSLLYPTPSTTLAYEKTHSVVNNENFETNKQANNQFASKFQLDYITEPQALAELNHTTNLINFQLENLEFIVAELMFAKNTAVYNSKANELGKLEQEILEKINNAVNYIDNEVTPVLNQANTPSKSALNTLRTAMVNNNKQVIAAITKFSTTVTTIYIDLENNFTANPHSKKVLQIVSVWTQSQNDYLASENFNASKAALNLTRLKEFKTSKLESSVVLNYHEFKETYDEALQSLSKANIKGLTDKIEIEDVDAFIEGIENEEIKTSTLALKNFILGGE